MAKKKKRKGSYSWILISLLLLTIIYLVLFWGLNNSKLRAFKDQFHHQSANVTHPASADFTVHGIDVSRYQKLIDWYRVKQTKINGHPINFAFAKATEGYSLRDPMFDRNSRHARQNGLAFGAYHFFNPRLDPRKQANFFIENYSAQSGDLPPVVDIEKHGGQNKFQIRQKLEVFLDILEDHYGVRPIIYTYMNFYMSYLYPNFQGYPFWIAHYYKKRLVASDKLNWIIWQYSDNGRIDGVSGPVDLNVFKGNLEDLQNLRRK
jgi:lysozyme